MSSTAQNPGPGEVLVPSVTEIEDVVRHAGLILSHVNLYGFEHSTTRELARDTFQRVSGLLSKYHQLEVQLEPTCVRINGVAAGRNDPVVQAFATHLLNRDISQFSLAEGMTEPQFNQLIEVLGSDSETLHGAGGFEKAVSSGNLGGHVRDVRAAPSMGELAASVPPPMPEETPAGYYASKSRKVRDLLLGMFGVFNLQVVVTILLMIAYDNSVGRVVVPFLVGSFQLFCLIGIPMYFFRKKRKFVAIGYLISLGLMAVAPLLLVGACFIMLATGNLSI